MSTDVPELEEKLNGKTEELSEETKNAFFIKDDDTPPPIPRKRPRDAHDDDVIEIKQAEDDEKPFEIEWAQSNADLCLNERDRRLRARYGHVARGGGDDTHPQYQLHLKVDERYAFRLCLFRLPFGAQIFVTSGSAVYWLQRLKNTITDVVL